MLRLAAEMVPAFREAPFHTAWSTVRPLVGEADAAALRGGDPTLMYRHSCHHGSCGTANGNPKLLRRVCPTGVYPARHIQELRKKLEQ